MPIQPPRLDDRTYDDILREARALIPQYCPEWTHLEDSDPGMALVQLFAWMTELTLYRLNRVPDKTYVHFLEFIGEERRNATPARAPVTFCLRTPGNGSVDVPAGMRVSTRQRAGSHALHFLTTSPLTVHGAALDRLVAVAAGPRPLVREIPYARHPQAPGGLVLGDGQGVHPLHFDPVADGPRSWTADQFLYVRHERLASGGGATLRLRAAGPPSMPIAALFKWERRGADGGWSPLPTRDGGELAGLPERLLQLDGAVPAPIGHLGRDDAPLPLPADLPACGWIRGRVDWEPWLAARMEEELRVVWRDDRGGDDREVTHWYVRAAGRTLEFFLQHVPPLQAGWTLTLTLVDHGLRVGHDGLWPRYRWSWRRGDRWCPVPDHRVRQVGACFELTGPLPDLASDGYNLRAERVETLDIEAMLPGLQLDLACRRPISVHLATGPQADGAVLLPAAELPRAPFQPAPGLPAQVGAKLFLGSDLLANRARLPVSIELEIGFEREGEPVAEPTRDYHLQLACRTAGGWRVIPDGPVDLARFRFADLDPEGAGKRGPRRVRLCLDPRVHLGGLQRATLAGVETCWLQLELTRSALTWRKDDRAPPIPLDLRLHGVRMALAASPHATTWDEPLPGARVIAVEQRPRTPRFTRVTERRGGRVIHTLPQDPVLDLDDGPLGHHALYLRFDGALPEGLLTTAFRSRGETWLPPGTEVRWELLQASPDGRCGWSPIGSSQDPGGTFALERTGVLAFCLDGPARPPPEGVWLRVLFRSEGGGAPALPPLTHVLPNTVEAVNLHVFRDERSSGLGLPGQEVQLQHFPVYLPGGDVTSDPLADVVVEVEEEDGQRHRWHLAPGNTLRSASKDDRVFVVDPVEGRLTFGSGLRGRALPVGSFNVHVAGYHVVPGAAGNVGPGELCVVQGEQLSATNIVPATGGRDPESIDEIVRRAPSILTSRDRAVTRADFEALAVEASAEVARAACLGELGDDGGIETVILPRRRSGEALPDPYLAAGLRDHVAAWLRPRCLVNVRPRVRLATFQLVDVAIAVRLRPSAHRPEVRDRITAWVRRFLDPYEGGIDGSGWPFASAVFAQDLGRLVGEVPEVRHVVAVHLHPVGSPEPLAPGWTTGAGVQVLLLEQADLPHVRHVRVQWSEEEPCP